LSTPKASIGTKNESSLHRYLKLRYAGPGGKTEAEAGGFIADGISANGEYIEVQTRNFASLRAKIKEFTAAGRVRIIYPIAVTKIIEVYEPAQARRRKPLGKLLYRRKSPVKGSPWNLFDALVYTPELPSIRGLTIELFMADITEKRVKDGKGARRRKGISIIDHELAVWHENIALAKRADYRRFVPFKKNEEFTSSLLAQKAGIAPATARKALYVLTKLKLVKRTGRKGNSWIYVR
jgi:hypothetical protein